MTRQVISISSVPAENVLPTGDRRQENGSGEEASDILLFMVNRVGDNFRALPNFGYCGTRPSPFYAFVLAG